MSKQIFAIPFPRFALQRLIDTFAVSLFLSNLTEAILRFLSKQINKLVVITRGEKGAIAINGQEVTECGIQKNLQVIDLTGAGDLFAAGFLHSYINKLSTKDSLEKGTEMSSKIIQQIGARL